MAMKYYPFIPTVVARTMTKENKISVITNSQSPGINSLTLWSPKRGVWDGRVEANMKT